MNPGFPADFTDEPDDSEYVAQGIIEIEEKRLGRKLTKKERQEIVESVTPDHLKEQPKADELGSQAANTEEEKELLRELRRRKNEGLLTLSEAEFAKCLVIARRRPHLKDMPDESLRGIIIGDLV